MKLISRLIVIFFILGLIAVCLPHKVLAVSSDEEIASLLSKAIHGDAAAQYNLGIMYDKGEEVPHNSKQAFYWYKKAAEQGVAEAQYNVAVMYGGGRGIRRNSKQAFYWYKKAAEQGVAKAQYDLAVMYGRGVEGVPHDPEQEAYWYKKAAEQGVAKAQYDLAVMYGRGVEGVPHDPEQEDNLAQSRIAEGNKERFPMFGRNDHNKLVDWYEKVAEQGDCRAQYTLAEMYREGKGVPQDYVIAYAWFNIIVSKDWTSFRKRAEKSRDEMVEMMSPDQIDKGKKLSKGLYEKIYN